MEGASRRMVNAQTRVASVRVPKVIPEGVDALVRMQAAQGVGPALGKKAAERVAHLGPKQRVVQPAFWLVDVKLGRHDVKISSEYDRSPGRYKLAGVVDQALEPTQLIIELGTGGRISIRKIQTADPEVVGGGFDVTALEVVWLTWQTSPSFNRIDAAGQDGDSVPALLPMPNRVVACFSDRPIGEFLPWRLQLLKTNHIGRRLLKATEEDRQPPVDAVHVVGRDPHRSG